MARFDGGWFRIDRKLLTSDFFDDDKLFKLWILLISWANIDDGKRKIAGHNSILKRGQLCTSYEELAKCINSTQKIVRNRLKFLKEIGKIGHEKGRRGSIITIYKYEAYQTPNSNEGNLRATKGQPKGNIINKVNKLTNNILSDKPDTIAVNDDTHPTTLKDSKVVKTDYEGFSKIWNDNCGSLSKVTRLSSKRKSRIKSRLREEPDFNFWEKIIKRMAASDFCSTNSFATIDWIIANDENYTKVMEGKYDNRDTVQFKSISSSSCPKCKDRGWLNGDDGYYLCGSCDRHKEVNLEVRRFHPSTIKEENAANSAH